MLKVPSGSQLGTGNSDLRNLWFCVLCFSKIAFQKGLCRYAFHVSFAGLEKTVFCSCFDVSKGADWAIVEPFLVEVYLCIHSMYVFSSRRGAWSNETSFSRSHGNQALGVDVFIPWFGKWQIWNHWYYPIGFLWQIFSVPDWASLHHWEAFHRLVRPDQLHLWKWCLVGWWVIRPAGRDKARNPTWGRDTREMFGEFPRFSGWTLFEVWRLFFSSASKLGWINTLQCGAYESCVFRENLAKSEAPSKDFPPKRPVATFPAVSARISVDHACVLEVWKPTAVRQHRLGPPGSSRGRLAEWDLVNPRCLPQAIWGLYFVLAHQFVARIF